MAKIPIELDVDDAVEEIVTKLERKLEKVEKENIQLRADKMQLTETMGRMKKAKDALREAADWLDPFRYDDD